MVSIRSSEVRFLTHQRENGTARKFSSAPVSLKEVPSRPVICSTKHPPPIPLLCPATVKRSCPVRPFIRQRDFDPVPLFFWRLITSPVPSCRISATGHRSRHVPLFLVTGERKTIPSGPVVCAATGDEKQSAFPSRSPVTSTEKNKT